MTDPGPTPDQPETGQPADGYWQAGTAGSAQPPYGQSPSAQSPYGQPSYGQPSYGQPSYGQPSYGQPSPAQPPYGQSPYGQPAGSGGFLPQGDVLAAGPVRPRRRLAPIVASVVAVLAIVLAGGGFAAYHLLAAKGGQPDAWAPANSLLYAKVDLDPSASAKVAAWRFEQHFPNAPKIASADDLKDALLEAAFRSDGKVDYNADIKPWLGDRVGLAVFSDAGGKPQTVGIVAVKDAGKAKSSLAKINAKNPIGYSSQGSFVVIGDSQAIVDDAVSAAKKANITSNADYAKDVAALKNDRIVTGWWNAGATIKAMAPELPPQSRALLSSGALAGLGNLDKLRMAFGVRVQPSDVEVEARTFGTPTTTPAGHGTAGAALGGLPAGTVAGFAVADPKGLLQQQLASLQSGILGAGLQTQLQALGAQLGIALPGDLENLLGSSLAVGLNSVPSAAVGKALVTVMTNPTDPAKGLHTAQVLAAAISAQTGLQLSASSHGAAVVLTNDKAATTGKLADDAGFGAALAGMPSDATLAGYVNLAALMAAQPNMRPDTKPLQSIGFYQRSDGNAQALFLRLTVK